MCPKDRAATSPQSFAKVTCKLDSYPGGVVGPSLHADCSISANSGVFVQPELKY